MSDNERDAAGSVDNLPRSGVPTPSNRFVSKGLRGSTTPDLRDVMIVAHPAGTAMIDVTKLTEREVAYQTEAAIARLRDVLLTEDGARVAEVSLVRIPAGTFAAMRNASMLWVTR